MTSGIVSSPDTAKRWNNASNGLRSWLKIGMSLNSLLTADSKLYTAAWQGGVSVSSDNGLSWTPFEKGIDDAEMCAMATNGKTLFASANPFPRQMYCVTIGDSVWKDMKLTPSMIISTILPRGKKLFVGSDKGLFVSENSDSTWVKIPSILADAGVTTLIDGGTDLYGIFRNSSGRYDLYVTADEGVTWRAVPIAGNPSVSCFYKYKNMLFAGLAGGTDGIVKSNDNGATWFSLGLPNTSVYSVMVHAGYLFVGTSGGGIWRYKSGEYVTAVPSTEPNPAGYALAQNYPNPFNPSTTISFSIPSRSFVTLKIFDVMGREVSTVVSQEMPAGSYSRQWNATGYPSGVYFYRLHAGPFSQTMKLAVIK
jgi:hypothetical protein